LIETCMLALDTPAGCWLATSVMRRSQVTA